MNEFVQGQFTIKRDFAISHVVPHAVCRSLFGHRVHSLVEFVVFVPEAIRFPDPSELIQDDSCECGSGAVLCRLQESGRPQVQVVDVVFVHILYSLKDL